MRYTVCLLICATFVAIAPPAHARGRSHGRGGGGGSNGPGGAGMVAARNRQALAMANRMATRLNQFHARNRAAEQALYASKQYRDNKQKAAVFYGQHKGEQKEEHERFVASQTKGAPRLTESQLDRETGVISWPAGLKHKDFQEHRSAVSKLVADHAKSGETAISHDFTNKLHSNVTNMETILRQHMGDMPTTDYVAAKRFLDSLAEEGHTHIETQ